MSWSTARQDLKTYMNTNWTTTSIQWQNLKFNQPNSDPWIRFQILEGEGRQVSMGNKQTHRVPGMVMFSIFVPQDSGMSVVDTYVDAIDALFTSKRIGIVQCRSITKEVIGEVEDKFMVNVRLPFYFDRVITQS